MNDRRVIETPREGTHREHPIILLVNVTVKYPLSSDSTWTPEVRPTSEKQLNMVNASE